MLQNTSKLVPKSLKSLQSSYKSNHSTIVPIFSKPFPYLNNYNSTIKLLFLRSLNTQTFPLPPLSTPTPSQITTPQLTPSLPERPKFFLQKDFEFLNAKVNEEEDKNEENERPLREKVILLSQRDKLEEAVQLVLESDINDQSEITWNQLIVECVDKGRVKLGVRLLNEMKRFSLQPSQNTYSLLLNGLAEYRALPDNIFHARAIVDGIRRSSRTKSTYRLTVNHANALLKVCFRANEFEALISNYDVFFNPGNQGNLSLTPNKETHTIVLAACAKNCKKHADQAFEIATNIWSSVYERAMYFVRKPSQRPMKEEDSIDDDLVCAILLCFRNVGQVEKGFEIIRNIYGIGDDTVRPLPYNIQMTSKSLDIMLGLCFKSQQPELGVKLFSEARLRFPHMVPDIQNFNSLISLFNETKRYDEAIGAFKQVLELGLEPGSLTFDLLMESCKNTKTLDIVKDIFGIIIKHRVIPKATALTKILEMTMESDSNIMVREVRWILNKVDQIGLNDPISLVASATRQGVPKLPFEIDDETFLKTIINAYGIALDKSGGKLPDNTEERWKNNLKFYKTRLWDLNQKNSQIEQSRFLKDKVRLDRKLLRREPLSSLPPKLNNFNNAEDRLLPRKKIGRQTNWLDDDETIILDDDNKKNAYSSEESYEPRKKRMPHNEDDDNQIERGGPYRGGNRESSLSPPLRTREPLSPPFQTRDPPTFQTRDPPPFQTRDPPTFQTRDSPTFQTRDSPSFQTRDPPPPFQTRDPSPSPLLQNREPPLRTRESPLPPLRTREPPLPPLRTREPPLPPLQTREPPPPLRTRELSSPLRTREPPLPPLRTREPPPLQYREPLPPLRNRESPPPLRTREPHLQYREPPLPSRNRESAPASQYRESSPSLRNREPSSSSSRNWKPSSPSSRYRE